MSHHTQRSGQPVRRTNTHGCPARVPSPWIEKKISLTVSRDAVRRSSYTSRCSRGLPRPARAGGSRALGPQSLPHLLEEVTGHHLRGRALAGEGRVLVDVLVVEARGDLAHGLLQVLEVHDHADPVEDVAGRHRLHAPVVAVQRLDRPAVVGQDVGGAERRLVGNLEQGDLPAPMVPPPREAVQPQAPAGVRRAGEPGPAYGYRQTLGEEPSPWKPSSRTRWRW